jgi:prepilin-type N-terminal cleavage/methylation domain-containing protein
VTIEDDVGCTTGAVDEERDMRSILTGIHPSQTLLKPRRPIVKIAGSVRDNLPHSVRKCSMLTRSHKTAYRHLNAPAFTLIELLVVIAILALLVSILLPGLHKAKDLAKMTLCATNQRGLLNATALYANDNQGRLPYAGRWWEYAQMRYVIYAPRDGHGYDPKVYGFVGSGLLTPTEYVEANSPLFFCPMQQHPGHSFESTTNVTTESQMYPEDFSRYGLVKRTMGFLWRDFDETSGLDSPSVEKMGSLAVLADVFYAKDKVLQSHVSTVNVGYAGGSVVRRDININSVPNDVMPPAASKEAMLNIWEDYD